MVSWIKEKLNIWHTEVHSNYDYTKVLEANKEIDRLMKINKELGKEVKKLKLQIEMKQMDDSFEN